MADYFCDTELTTGANDGTSMDNAWQSIKTAMENVVMAAGDICWFRRRSNFYNPSANITPTIDGTLKDPIQWIGWPRDELKGSVDFINDSNVLVDASVSPKFERHAGRYIRNDTDGRDYLLTAIAQELKYSNKSGEFTEGLMVTGQSSGAQGKIHKIIEDDGALRQSILDTVIGQWRLEDGSGLKAVDESGYGNDGDLEGDMDDSDWVPGKCGECLNFDGVDQRLDCGNSSPLDQIGNGDFWLSFRMKSKDTVPLNWGRIFSKEVDPNNWILLCSNGTLSQLYFIMKSGGAGVSTAFSMNANIFDASWRHIILVIDRTTDKALCYVDTTKDDIEIDISSCPADCTNIANLSWGAIHAGGFPYEGLEDELLVGTGILTQEKVNYLYDHPDIGKKVLWIVSKSRNLIDRGDCEDDIPPAIFGELDPYIVRNTWERDFTQKHSNSSSYKFTKAAPAGQNCFTDLVDSNDIDDLHGSVPGKRHKWSVWIRLPSSLPTLEIAKLEFYCYYGGGWHVQGNTLFQAIYDEWQCVEVTVTIPLTTTGTIFRIRGDDTWDYDDYFNADDIEIWEVFEDNEQITDTSTGVANVNGTPVDAGFVIDRPYVGASVSAGAFTIAKDEDHALAQAIDDLAWTIKKADYNGDVDELPVIDFGQLNYYLRPYFAYATIFKNFSFRNGVSGMGTVSPYYDRGILFKGCHFLQYNNVCCFRLSTDSAIIERFIMRGTDGGTSQRGIYGVRKYYLIDGAIYNMGGYLMLDTESEGKNLNIGIELPDYTPNFRGAIRGSDIKADSIGMLPSSIKENICIENYQKIKGAHKTWYINGTITKVDVVIESGDPQKRSGGADSVIEVTANQSAASEAVEEWAQEIFCHEIWVDLTSKSYRYYVQCKDMESEQNLLGLWRFDETTGLIAADSSKYGNDGDLEGTFTDDDWVAGKSNNALSFGGANQRVDCGNAAPLNTIGNGSFWIPFWMKSKDTVPLSGGRLFIKRQDASNYFTLCSYATSNRLRFEMCKGGVYSGNYDFSIATQPFDTLWNHIVFVVNRTTDKAIVYMNTVKDATELDISACPADCSNTGNLSWGAVDDGTVPYEGLIDEGGAYKGLPTKAKIDYLYAHPPGRVLNLSTLPSQLWLEVEYCDQYDGPSKYRYVKVKSTRKCLERTGADDWTQYLEVIGIQPAVAGLVRIRGFISHYDPDGKIYIDPGVVIF